MRQKDGVVWIWQAVCQCPATLPRCSRQTAETKYRNYSARDSTLYSKNVLAEFKMCLHELSLVDDTMEAVGAPKEYQRLRKWIIRIIIGWIVFTFNEFVSITYIDFLHGYNNTNLVETYFLFVMRFPKYVHILSTLIWGTILGLVYIYFVSYFLLTVCVKMFTI
ncbi:hypothetical protein ALC60_07476 [Trachymyrmex zeteki]|uniref:Uncharacterized protein n=1 Tax=Mycetomoellerius zeteki TaxID=64791 RepID=A0A151X0F2_9HYME|nr:hypothetical protein ALC60_07476 [Trachymyrmex zeteki]